MHSIQKITSTETYPVRHIVLRAGKPIESCQFDGDELGSTHHFGYYLNNQIIGVISIFEIKNEQFVAQKSFQIRGMAVLENWKSSLMIRFSTIAALISFAWFSLKEVLLKIFF